MKPTYSILIVDDILANIYTIEELIKSNYNYIQIYRAESAQIGLKILIEHKIDLVILDIQMPEISGFEMAELMRMNLKTKDIPIIFLTAVYNSDEFREIGFKVGAIDYLSKPIDELQFINRLNLYFRIFQKEFEATQKEKQIHTLFEIQPNIVFVADKDNLYYSNREFEEFFGKDLNKNSFHFTNFILDELIGFDEFIKSYYRFKAINKSRKVKLQSKDGAVGVFIIEIKPYPLKKHSVIIILTDVTFDAKEMEEIKDKQKVQEALLFQQSKMASIGETLGAITHQWNQPLNNISLLLSNLHEKCLTINVKYDKYFSQIQEQIQYLSQTILDFKNFFAPDKAVSIFDVALAIDEVVKIVDNRLLINSIELHENFAKECFTKGYKNEFKHSIINILNNAIDAIVTYRKRNSLTDYDYLGAININISKNSDYILIEIEDNGGGIETEFLPKLFKQFETTKGEKGSGIGLYMTKTIIEERLMGKIEANNGLNGAIFKITLNMEKTYG